MSKAKQSVSQFSSDGLLLAKYPSITAAGLATGTQVAHIGKVCNGKRKTAGGCSWNYNKSFTTAMRGKGTALVQSDLNGIVLAVFTNPAAAATVTGLKEAAIDRLLSSGRASKGTRFSTVV